VTTPGGAAAHLADKYGVDTAGTKGKATPMPKNLLSHISHVSPEDRDWRTPLRDEAFLGPIGELARMVGPHSEADPVALLVQPLLMFGNVVGRGPHWVVEDDRHALNEFAMFVGPTSRARKGTSLGRSRAVFGSVDEKWNTDRIKSGLSSGEGLIEAVRDPRSDQVREKDTDGTLPDHWTGKVIDPGVEDKRLLVLETELSTLFVVKGRDGNVVSQRLRNAWDGQRLETMTRRQNALRSTDHHISIIGHITQSELQRCVSTTDLTNGLVNRFLILAVRRSKQLPFGGSDGQVDYRPIVRELRQAAGFARNVGMIGMTPAARDLWLAAYPVLTRDLPGLFGSAVARAEAHVRRLACIYALTEGQSTVDLTHLKAALAVWDYSEQSTQMLFGDTSGDPVSDRLLEELRLHETGLARTDIRDLFSRHGDKSRTDSILSDLQARGLACMEELATGGRPKEMWFAIDGDLSEKSDKSSPYADLFA
jgi:hypothetical protein